jgi:hypothetical protein
MRDSLHGKKEVPSSRMDPSRTRYLHAFIAPNFCPIEIWTRLINRGTRKQIASYLHREAQSLKEDPYLVYTKFNVVKTQAFYPKNCSIYELNCRVLKRN